VVQAANTSVAESNTARDIVVLRSGSPELLPWSAEYVMHRIPGDSTPQRQPHPKRTATEQAGGALVTATEQAGGVSGVAGSFLVHYGIDFPTAVSWHKQLPLH
jgi:hypothetical protein